MKNKWASWVVCVAPARACASGLRRSAKKSRWPWKKSGPLKWRARAGRLEPLPFWKAVIFFRLQNKSFQLEKRRRYIVQNNRRPTVHVNSKVNLWPFHSSLEFNYYEDKINQGKRILRRKTLTPSLRPPNPHWDPDSTRKGWASPMGQSKVF